jgi:hypothetical protein
MWRTCVVVALLCLVTGMAAAQENQGNRRGDCDYWCQIFGGDNALRRMGPPSRPSDYYIPRSVGAWSQINDMTIAPEPWWSLTTGRPFWQTLAAMKNEHELSAIGFGLRAHPFVNYDENIRRAFRSGDVDVMVLWVSHWIETGTSCDGNAYVEWQMYPESLFEELYNNYGDRPLTIIVMTFESDVRLHGKACQERDECSWYDLDGCIERCEGGTMFVNNWLPDGYVEPADCRSICCDQNKLDRQHYMLNVLNARQKAVAEARWKYRHANLEVFLGIEVDRYGRQDEWLLVARDVIPLMDSLEGVMVGLSCWPNKCGRTEDEVIESFNRVMEWTGLPPYRLFVAEVGAQELAAGDQYNRIMTVVSALFDRGAAFALVWSLEQQEGKQQTLHAVIDPETGEYRSGMDAIKELNDAYAE